MKAGSFSTAVKMHWFETPSWFDSVTLCLCGKSFYYLLDML